MVTPEFDSRSVLAQIVLSLSALYQMPTGARDVDPLLVVSLRHYKPGFSKKTQNLLGMKNGAAVAENSLIPH